MRLSRMTRVASVAALAFAAAVLPAGAQEKLKVAAISGYFSQGFGISIMQGLERAKKDFGIDVTVVDTGNRALDYEEQFNNLAEGNYDLVFVMGWELVDALTKTSAAHPDQHFVFIDGVLDDPNMTYVDFAEEEGSYLVGALTGLLARDKVEGFDSSQKLGFVGGRDIPVIRNFLNGMVEGAAHVNPEANVVNVFAGTFDDPAKGSELAMTLYGQDVDVIYQAAGPTGEGVMQAAKAAGKYAVGVDVDQCPSAPGAVLASMLKRADVAVYDLIKGTADGTAPVKPGAIKAGIANGGIELKICDDIKDRVPAAIQEELEKTRAAIASGEIKVTLNQ